ncbi:COP9 signalosome (CSN) subunit [Savitreella phatthalungensis]
MSAPQTAAPSYTSLATFLSSLERALSRQEGLTLERLLCLSDRDKNAAVWRLAETGVVSRETLDEHLLREQVCRTSLSVHWRSVAEMFWKAAGCLGDASGAIDGFGYVSAMAGGILKGFGQGGWEAWLLPVLFSVCRDVRVAGARADAYAASMHLGDTALGTTDARTALPGSRGREHLEEAARIINRAFTTCITDRASLESSRKWGTYCIVGILFRTYFALDKLSLTRNVLRAIEVSELPPLQYFPRGHQLTWRYYLGVLAFMREDYAIADRELQTALDLSSTAISHHNVQMILTYLIPTRLMTTRTLPSLEILRKFPKLAGLYRPLVAALRSGNVAAYDKTLVKNERELVRRRVYLTFERTRILCVRSLARKVWLLRGRETRLPVDCFVAALNTGNRESPDASLVDVDEAECAVANLIYAGLVKGYISREKRMVVLSAKDPFPKLVRASPGGAQTSTV